MFESETSFYSILQEWIESKKRGEIKGMIKKEKKKERKKNRWKVVPSIWMCAISGEVEVEVDLQVKFRL